MKPINKPADLLAAFLLARYLPPAERDAALDALQRVCLSKGPPFTGLFAEYKKRMPYEQQVS